MFEKIFDRRNLVVVMVLILFGVLFFRLAEFTIIKGEEYRKKAEDSFLQRITLSAKRGEIYDRNGVLLAGNVPSYTVKLLDAPQYASEVDRVAIDLLTLLEERDESYLDFPIEIVDGKFYFSDDIKTEDWLDRNGFESGTSAEDVFAAVRLQEYIDESLDRYDAQEMMLYQGISLPISVRNMKFRYKLNKEKFLGRYDLEDEITAKEAFEALRDKYIKESKQVNYTDEEMLKIIIVRDAFKQQGYLSYIPVEIASNISKETAVLIEESGMEFPGVSVEVDPVRNYPFDDSAAHVIGYMGKIATSKEIEMYNSETGYNPNDLIGKTGLEKNYESVLHGEDGYKYIYADARGNYIGDFIDGIQGKESKVANSGEDITLSIDIELQQAVEHYLSYGLEQIQKGESYKSRWGETNYDQFENAQSGAAMVVKVDTGEVLAMANYPSYDLNLFKTGISSADWASLQPENPKNPLAPRPLFNIAAYTAVQPGSTFKPLTVLAALEQGMDPTLKLFADGVVEVGGRLFRCWYYRAPYHGKHGWTDIYRAIEVSCNYIMFDLVRGYDYYKNQPLDFTMDTQTLLKYTEMFGLGEASGIEIRETVVGVPSREIKKINYVKSLRSFLSNILDQFYDPIRLENEDEKQMIIDEIVSWVDEYLDEGLSRNEVIRRMMALEPTVDMDEVSLLADYVIYDYFKQIPWREGDDLNLSIGQGDHRYTVAQMVRYVAAVANGGYLNELTLINKIGDEVQDKTTDVTVAMNSLENLDHIKEGMRRVAHGTSGSARSVFQNFDFEVGAKTGTAQKAGRIPPQDLQAYIREILDDVVTEANKGVSPSSDAYLNITKKMVEDQTEELLSERNEELAELLKQSNALEDGPEKEELSTKLETKAAGTYLDRGYIMKEVLLELGQGKITNEMIDSYREEYDPFAWFISFAPFDDPEIAVAVLVPQGGHGGYAAPIVRDIYANYFGIFDYENISNE